jgi:signal transduction histidine kinase
VTQNGTPNSSLVRRLVVLAAGWSVAVLVVSAVVLVLLFQQAVLRRFDQSLSELIDNLLAASTIGDRGEVIAPALTDERALRAFSGKYWVIAEPTADGRARSLVRSRSLWDAELAVPPGVVAQINAKPGPPVAYDTRGPLGEPLRVLAAEAQLPGRKAPVIFLAAEDRTPVDRDVRGFMTATAVAFVLLTAGLIAAVVVQVRFGLKPLFDELNALMAHNQEVVERQRTHVGNLAHALKTPLSVMLTESAQRPGPLAEVVGRQAEAMRQQVDHHLRRARAAARNQSSAERTGVAEVLDELVRTLERIFHDKGVVIDWDADDELTFQGERQDLLEIAGNAMENACKWCKGKVRVRAVDISPTRFSLTVEDDGPGLPPERWEEVIQRGARLDETAPGSGLGLSIIDELARAYGGSFRLGRATLGGLAAFIELPRAES